jgi:hypothetical protein
MEVRDPDTSVTTAQPHYPYLLALAHYGRILAPLLAVLCAALVVFIGGTALSWVLAALFGAFTLFVTGLASDIARLLVETLIPR